MGRREDPAGRDQTPPAAENLLLGPAAPKYGGNPGVELHRGNRSPHDLHLLAAAALPTCWFCAWGGEKQVQLGRGPKKKRENDGVSQVVGIPGPGSAGSGKGGAGTTR